MLDDRKYAFDAAAHREQLIPLLKIILSAPGRLSSREHQQLMRRYPKPAGEGFYSLANLVDGFRVFAGQDGLPAYDEALLYKLRRKPVRTLSGVTPLTLLTKPSPARAPASSAPTMCACPKATWLTSQARSGPRKMPSTPYLQTWTRLQTYHNLGHSTDKIEIIILGGTWSFYPETYQIWFVKRIFDAMHDFGKGRDRRPEAVAALREKSQFSGVPISDVTINGAAMAASYNQTVQGHLRRRDAPFARLGRADRHRTA